MDTKQESMHQTAETQDPACCICGNDRDISKINLGNVLYAFACNGCISHINKIYVIACKACGSHCTDLKESVMKRIQDPEIKNILLTTQHPYIHVIESCIICEPHDFIFDEYHNFLRAPSKQA